MEIGVLLNSIWVFLKESYLYIYEYIPADIIYQIFNTAFYFFLTIMMLISAIYFVLTIYNIFLKNKDKEKEFDIKKAPFVTIQIPTYNELVALRCAKKCLEFDYPKDKYEIIVGDDSNKPEISKEIDDFANENNIKVTRRGSNIGYKAGNLNHMLKYSKGEVIVIFDSDFIPEKDFLKKIITPFIYDKKIAGVQARWKFINTNQNIISILGATIVAVFHQVVLPFMKKNNISMLCGSAEAVKKKILIKLGGWKHGSLTEDIEYSLRLLNNGYKIKYLEKLECAGEVPYTAKDLYKQQMRWAYGVCHAFKEHGKDIFFNKNINYKEKFCIFVQASGYFFSTFLLFIFLTGFLSFIFHPPGPIDFGKFFIETARNILTTTGLLIAGAYSLYKINQKKTIFKAIASSLSYGLIVVYYVNKGIFKVFLNRPMQWHMLNKVGNKSVN